MKDFLLKILGVSVLLSVIHVMYLYLAMACVLAIVINSYLETKINTLSSQKKEIESLTEELKSTIRHLESEQNVMKMKVQNLTNPGRKL